MILRIRGDALPFASERGGKIATGHKSSRDVKNMLIIASPLHTDKSDGGTVCALLLIRMLFVRFSKIYMDMT